MYMYTVGLIMSIYVHCITQEYCTYIIYMYMHVFRSTTTSSLEVSSNAGMGGSCPSSPSVPHRGMKHAGSETNVWSRLANSSNESSGDKGYNLWMEGGRGRERERERERRLHCTRVLFYRKLCFLSCRKGMMQSERDSRRMSSRLLTCTHTASGHTAGVLCVYATQNYLFSSSQGVYTLYVNIHVHVKYRVEVH